MSDNFGLLRAQIYKKKKYQAKKREKRLDIKKSQIKY